MKGTKAKSKFRMQNIFHHWKRATSHSPEQNQLKSEKR